MRSRAVLLPIGTPASRAMLVEAWNLIGVNAYEKSEKA